MTWQLTMEFSGITLLHLSKGETGDYGGTALFSPGLSNKHTPFMYVPMEGFEDPPSFAKARAVAAFGLRTIPTTGGRYLLEVALEGAEVDFAAGIVPRGPISFAKTSYPGKPSTLPPDWHDLVNSVDLRALAQKYNSRRTVDSTKARGKVWLPGGRLIGTPFVSSHDRYRVWDLSVEEAGGAKTPVFTQHIADRQALLSQCSDSEVMITVRKGTDLLNLPFGPRDGEKEMAVVFSSNCVAGTGAADELTEFVPLLDPGAVTFWMDKMLSTDDHPCVTAIWIEP